MTGTSNRNQCSVRMANTNRLSVHQKYVICKLVAALGFLALSWPSSDLEKASLLSQFVSNAAAIYGEVGRWMKANGIIADLKLATLGGYPRSDAGVA